jgi:peptidoglycan/LPS O-acetylase OafA/YrhL
MPDQTKPNRGLAQRAVPADPIPVSGSMLLDVIRFAAAIAVALGHLSSPMFSTHWPWLLNLALSAVAVFFVLSGFVIRLISIARSMTAAEYAIDRISRIYSVLLPALLITIAVTLCLYLLPAGRIFRPGFSIPTIATQFFACMTFVGSFWGLDVPMSFNTVFWSLSYECAYYAFYGIAFFGRGPWKWVLLSGLAILVGPPILFMLPLWLFGCFICDAYHWLRRRKYPLTTYFGGILGLFLLALMLRTAAAALKRTSVAAPLRIHRQNLVQWTHSHHLHLLQRASFQGYSVGIPVGILIVGLLLAADHLAISRKHASVSLVRRVADGTFTLYLIHLPLFILFAAYIPYDHASSWQKLFLLAVTIAIAVALASPTDIFKRWMRKALSSRLPQKAPIP